MVDGLAGQGDDPDLSHLDRGLFDAAAEAQHLATLGGVLHYLGGTVLDIRRATIPESSNIQKKQTPSRRPSRKPEEAQGPSRLAEWGGQCQAWYFSDYKQTEECIYRSPNSGTHAAPWKSLK